MLLQQFYIQENKKGNTTTTQPRHAKALLTSSIAPSPRPKQNRALKLSIQDVDSYNDAAKANLSDMLPPI